MNIKVKYGGSYPNLCSGKLTVFIDGSMWKFPDYCMHSGGICSFGADWEEIVEEGPWSIVEWPDGFPEELKEAVNEAVNDQVPHGCCGGCL